MSNDCITQWVTNFSNRIQSDTELRILTKVPNFAVTPKKVPVVDIVIVTVTESACRNLHEGDASELHSKVVVNLKNRKTGTPTYAKKRGRQ